MCFRITCYISSAQSLLTRTLSTLLENSHNPLCRSLVLRWLAVLDLPCLASTLITTIPLVSLFFTPNRSEPLFHIAPRSPVYTRNCRYRLFDPPTVATAGPRVMRILRHLPWLFVPLVSAIFRGQPSVPHSGDCTKPQLHTIYVGGPCDVDDCTGWITNKTGVVLCQNQYYPLANACSEQQGVDKKNPVKPRLHAVLPGGDVTAAGDLVQACTSSPRRYSSASRPRPAPACQGIAPRRAGTSSYPHGEELFLAEQVKACTGLPRNNSSASWYKLVAARR
ncbi:hypothetical protein PCANC_26517 [Puccinia coronata f. sp. avenae]|uniref:Uncharacterized protein n=1 Tax=Puccinia coronata f. sp. avenae TaxID=200324 RepID=A0A2N5RYD4_9BASI|nr:hypothetical protein PCANC_26517 [Puccinia coronata f. sp. avenae]